MTTTEDMDVFDALMIQPSFDTASGRDLIDTLLDLWETPGIGMGQIRDCLDSLSAQRRLYLQGKQEELQTTPAVTKVKPKYSKRYTRPRKRVTDDDYRTMQKLRAAGMTYADIALKMGFSSSAVHKQLVGDRGART